MAGHWVFPIFNLRKGYLVKFLLKQTKGMKKGEDSLSLENCTKRSQPSHAILPLPPTPHLLIQAVSVFIAYVCGSFRPCSSACRKTFRWNTLRIFKSLSTFQQF